MPNCARRRTAPGSRVLAVGDAAMLTVCDAHGYTEKLLAGTSDPTLVRDGRISYRLLHYVLTLPGPALRPDDYLTSIYLEAKPELSVSSVGRLALRFKHIAREGQRASGDRQRLAASHSTTEAQSMMALRCYSRTRHRCE
jgi:hypothetical protein